jgi:hypothetical protein
MKKLIFFVLLTILFANDYYKKDYDFLTSKEFQEKLDNKLKKLENDIVNRKKELIKLLDELNNHVNILSADELAKDYVKIMKKLSHTWLDNITYFNDLYVDGKNIVFEYLIKDDEKMRKNFKDEKFKNTIYKAVKFSQQRVTCNSMTPFLEKLFNNGYKLVYVYKYMSDKKEIFRVAIDKNSCKGK